MCSLRFKNEEQLRLFLDGEASKGKASKPKGGPRGFEEWKIQCAYFRWVREAERIFPQLAWIYGSMSAEKRDGRRAMNAKRMGLKRGIWDVHIPHPQRTDTIVNSIRYCGLWGEFKVKPNKLTPEQKMFQECNPWFEFKVWYSAEEAIKDTMEYLGLDI